LRFVIVGAGAVGGVIGARLFQAGHEVVLVARGRHLEAIRSEGLTLITDEESFNLKIPAVSHPAEAGLTPGDVAIIATKSQDTSAVLDGLVATGCDGLSVVCAQNGVSNEVTALRRFEDVYGICVMLPSNHLEPGVVEAACFPTMGILDIGRYPSGAGSRAEAIAKALEEATFVSVPREEIMRWKYRKLLSNLHNALDAVMSGGPWPAEIVEAVDREGEEVLAAAGIDVATQEEDAERRGEILSMGKRSERGGGSSWQSLQRGLGTIETDFLNGEIVLLGRLHGIPTPANALLQRVANEAARAKMPPGQMSAQDLLSRLG
jgi:2-dehydropantoate 2-reductase